VICSSVGAVLLDPVILRPGMPPRANCQELAKRGVVPLPGCVTVTGLRLRGTVDRPRPASPSQEQAYLAYANRPRRPGASSPFRGVSYRSRTGQWIAQLYWRGRRYFLGAYQDEREAAEVYNKHALQIIGPFAVVNDLTVVMANELTVAAGLDGPSPPQPPRARG
jgi:hypothetical protein